MAYRFILSLAMVGLAAAQGDWTCTGDSMCPSYAGAASNNTISANSKCVADPMQPQYGYCGYVGATCSDLYDCDFGLCVSGKCSGYFGAKCSAQADCLGHLPCGTDGTCGGVGGDCSSTLGASVCTSNVCGADKTCGAVPQNKMAAGSGCQDGSVCSSGTCGAAYTCQSSAAAAAPPSGASQAARHRARRDQRSHGHSGTNSFSKRRCPSHQTACLMGISSGSSAFECIDTTNSLESCGGCLPVPGSNATGFSDPAAPAGVDCTALPNVEEVSCLNSRCKILACRAGSSLNPDGTSCLLTV